MKKKYISGSRMIEYVTNIMEYWDFVSTPRLLSKHRLLNKSINSFIIDKSILKSCLMKRLQHNYYRFVEKSVVLLLKFSYLNTEILVSMLREKCTEQFKLLAKNTNNFKKFREFPLPLHGGGYAVVRRTRNDSV